MTHGDDFVVTGPNSQARRVQEQVGRSVPIKTMIISHRGESIKALNRGVSWSETGSAVPARPKTCGCAWSTKSDSQVPNRVQTPAAEHTLSEKLGTAGGGTIQQVQTKRRQMFVPPSRSS